MTGDPNQFTIASGLAWDVQEMEVTGQFDSWPALAMMLCSIVSIPMLDCLVWFVADILCPDGIPAQPSMHQQSATREEERVQGQWQTCQQQVVMLAAADLA